MPGAGVALRLDDVGAASKLHEVYGLTRVRVGTLAVPFPGNFLFLKYLPPIKRWGPYRELSASDWEGVLAALEAAHARMTVAVTAGWVESDGGVTPFPRKFPAAAGVIREGVRRGFDQFWLAALKCLKTSTTQERSFGDIFQNVQAASLGHLCRGEFQSRNGFLSGTD